MIVDVLQYHKMYVVFFHLFFGYLRWKCNLFINLFRFASFHSSYIGLKTLALWMLSFTNLFKIINELCEWISLIRAKVINRMEKEQKKKFVVKFCVIWIRKWYFREPCWKVVSLKIYAECFLIMLSRTRFNGSVGWWNITVIYRKIVRVENILIKHFLATILPYSLHHIDFSFLPIYFDIIIGQKWK